MPIPPQTKEAKEGKFHGVVRVEGVVTLKGNISNLRVVNSPGLGMDDVIVKTMKTWKCNPGVGPEGKRVPMLVPFEINFRLD
jgi:TonB family protein